MSIKKLKEEANSLYFNYQAAERKASDAILEARIRQQHDKADELFAEKQRAGKAVRASLDRIEMKVLNDEIAGTVLGQLEKAANEAREHLKKVGKVAMTLKTLKQVADLAEGLFKLVSKALPG